MNASLDWAQHQNQGVGYDLGSLARDVRAPRIARLAFVEGNGRLPKASTDNQVGFQLAEPMALIDGGRALLDRHLVRDGAASVAPAVGFPTGPLASQNAMQMATRAPVGVDVPMAGFMADFGLSGGLEVAGDLFRLPRLGKPSLGKSPGVSGNAAAVVTSLRMRLRELMHLLGDNRACPEFGEAGG